MPSVTTWRQGRRQRSRINLFVWTRESSAATSDGCNSRWGLQPRTAVRAKRAVPRRFLLAVVSPNPTTHVLSVSRSAAFSVERGEGVHFGTIYALFSPREGGHDSGGEVLSMQHCGSHSDRRRKLRAAAAHLQAVRLAHALVSLDVQRVYLHEKTYRHFLVRGYCSAGPPLDKQVQTNTGGKSKTPMLLAVRESPNLFQVGISGGLQQNSKHGRRQSDQKLVALTHI